MNKAFAALLLLTTTTSMAAPAAPPFIPRTGLWQFTIDYRLMGIPQDFKAYQIEQCLSPADPIPHIERHAECRHTQHQGLMPVPVMWFVDCSSDEELVHGQGRLNFMGERAQGNVFMQVLGMANPPQAMVFNLRGKYLGACP